MKTYLVIGARGKSGQHVAAQLVARGHAVRAASRTPEQLESPAHAVHFDWHDEQTWRPALRGAVGVYLVKPESEDVVETVSRFLDAMSECGVSRLVLLSECAAQTRTSDVSERQVEHLVESSELEWTILRPNWMMQDIVNEHFFGPLVREHRMIVMTTGGSPMAWVDARDIGAVAAELLASGDASHQALDITGPESLTLDQLAERITTFAGSPVAAVEETIEAAEDRMRSEGLDEAFIAYITRISRSIVAGDVAVVNNEVQRLTGQPPRTLDAFLAENADHLRAVSAVEAATAIESDSARQPWPAAENEALFRRQVAAWACSDLDTLLDCYIDDLTYADMPFPDAPVRGKVAFRKHMEAYNALFARGQIDVEIVTLVATDTHVVGELLSRAQYVGPGAPEGGVPVSWYATLVDAVSSGKIITEHAYFDPTAFEKAVGRRASA